MRPLAYLLLLLISSTAAPAMASADPAGEDVLLRALELVVQRYWRPEEVELDALLGSGLQRLERAGDRVVVTGPDGQGVYHVAIGDASKDFATRDVGDVNTVVQRMRQAMAFVEREAGSGTEELPELDVLAVQGMLQPLDSHCRVIDKTKLVDFEARYKGTLSGIGARIGKRNDVLTVVKVYPGTPAEAGDLRKGDVIARIDGVSTLNMRVSDAIDRIRGPEGTAVTVTIERAGTPGAFDVALVRAEVIVPTIEYRLLDGRYALLALDHFSQKTSAEFHTALLELRDQAGGELAGVIIDLRGNKGGSMLHASRIVNYFVDEGQILQTQGADSGAVEGLRHEVLAGADRTIAPWPVVILVDGSTASGSEILAGGLKFLDRALVIGTQTFGKGTVQKPYELRSELQMKLTVARYLVADGVWLAEVGITPDIVLGEVFIDDDSVVIADELFDPDAPAELGHADWEPTRDRGNAAGVFHLLYPYLAWAGDGYYRPGREDRSWQPDLATVLATRVLGGCAGNDRGALLDAARAVVEAERLHQQARLQAALTELGVPWTPAPSAWVDGAPTSEERARQALIRPPDPGLEATLETGELRAGESSTLSLRVTNRSDQPRSHLRAGLISDLRALDGIGFLIGDLEPGATATAVASIGLSPRARTRADDVLIELFDDAGPLDGPIRTHVVSRGTPPPRLAFRVRPTVKTLVDGGRHAAFTVDVRNDGAVRTGRVRVSLENPGKPGVELQEPYVELEDLEPGGQQTAAVNVVFAPGVATLRLVLRADDVDYDVGTSVALEVDPADPSCRKGWYQPPVIEVSGSDEPLRGEETLRIDASAVDDEGMDLVMVWINGDKIQVIEPSSPGRRLDVDAELPLDLGSNVLRLVAVDATGIRAERRYSVLGL